MHTRNCTNGTLTGPCPTAIEKNLKRLPVQYNGQNKSRGKKRQEGDKRRFGGNMGNYDEDIQKKKRRKKGQRYQYVYKRRQDDKKGCFKPRAKFNHWGGELYFFSDLGSPTFSFRFARNALSLAKIVNSKSSPNITTNESAKLNVGQREKPKNP
jgi:hypothetical protein